MPLPELPPRLEVPSHFSPSMLDVEPPCRLRILASAGVNDGRIEQLQPAPATAFGTLVHRALELLHSRDLAEIMSWFEESLDEPATPPARYSSLREAVAPRKIAGARALIKTEAARSPSSHALLSASSFQAKPHFGTEASLESDALRLRGRADVIRQASDGTIEIVDFKTGELRGPDGELRDVYVLQLQAYALMFRERAGVGSFRLILDNGSQELVDASDEALAIAEEHIHRFVELFPATSEVDTAGLAAPGRDCIRCAIRPSCSSYRHTAPLWWPDVPEEVGIAPPDTWGEVTAASETALGVTVRIRDTAGRGVQIADLDVHHRVDRASTGRPVWFFALAADNRRRGFHGQRPHPRTFHELVAETETGEQRAWSARVFLDGN